MDLEKKTSAFVHSKFRKEDMPSYEILFEYGPGNLAIFVNKTGELLFFDNFQWNYTDNKKEIENLNSIFASIDFLKDSKISDSCIISYRATVFTLIPSAIFEENHQNEYLNFVSSVDYPNVANTEIKSMKAHLVYPYQSEIVHFFQSKFETANVQNSTARWIEESLQTAAIGKEILHIRINSDFIELLLISNKNVKLSNTYRFTNADELLFYVLNVIQQYKLNTEKLEVLVSGFILPESKLYELFKKYFNKVNFNENHDNSEVDKGLKYMYYPFFSKHQ